jgi:hypothetical protein
MVAEQVSTIQTDQMVENALSFCATNHFQGDMQMALHALRQGRRDTCRDFTRSLGRQIAEYLSDANGMIKAVFDYELDPASVRAQSEKMASVRSAGINLVIWAGQKSSDILENAAKFEKVLEESLAKLGFGNSETMCFPLDIEIVDDDDVQKRRGYGLIVRGELIRSSQLWPGRDQPQRIELPDPRGYAQDSLVELLTSINPELAPENRLIDHAMAIEGVPPEGRGVLEYHLTELKVALIRKIISDQLSYIDIAKKWFTTEDLDDLHRRRIGYGRIGGKAAGMMLAARILNEVGDDDVKACLRIPESYFLGSELIYIFMAMNGLMHWNDQKYKPADRIRSEYAQIQDEFQSGEFPPEVILELQRILEEIGNKPLIVRSSSQLEDNFGTVFAGKYDSYFCPNQGTFKENFKALTTAIARTYASTLKPEALLYRRSKGLQDYDERMAVLIQIVQGEEFGRYYLPQISGVAFSRNLYRWSPEIRREDGFARLVWGMGTRAVGRVGDDYPRLVALSHPTLQPDDTAETISRYSQHYVDLIDLEDNEFKTLPIGEVLSPNYRPLRLIGQIEREGYFVSPRMRIMKDDIPRLAITFNDLLQRTPFASLLSKMLQTIENYYHTAVDMEFTVNIPDTRALNPDVQITLLQCRPQPHLQDIYAARVPKELSDEDIIFSTNFMVPRGYLPKIRYVIFVNPEGYYSLPSIAARNEIPVVISKLNALLGEKTFICAGPGRWGSSNTDLGIYISYADIHNAGALVEISGTGIGPAPEPSLGTHFFQDLMEAQIYPLALSLDHEDVVFNQEFFYDAPNALADWVQVDEQIIKSLKVIDVSAYRPGYHVEIVMDDEEGRAVAYLKAD